MNKLEPTDCFQIVNTICADFNIGLTNKELSEIFNTPKYMNPPKIEPFKDSMSKEQVKDLKRVLSIPTVTHNEKLMVDFLINWGITNNVKVVLDSYGNVYLIKGILEGDEKYPCVVAHMDTVHTSQRGLIERNKRLRIVEASDIEKNSSGSPEGIVEKLVAFNPETGFQTGIGGDDKCGVFICLELIKSFDKIVGAFFLGEEVGCLGSKNSDDNIFNNVGYIIEFDAPGKNWVSYVSMRTQLFNRPFFKKIEKFLLKYGLDNIHDNDPFTDIFVLKRKYPVNCLNLFAGYYWMHSSDEYVVPDDIFKAYSIGRDIISELGCKKYKFKYTGKITDMNKIINKLEKEKKC